MATARSNGTTAAPRKGGGRSSSKAKLPPITVAKLEETGRLLERVVSENTQLFIDKGHAYKEAHRDGSSRRLSPAEAAQVALVLSGTEGASLEAAQEAQDSSLRAYDEPGGREILLASGIGAAPGFVAAVRRVVALVEMAAADFEEACEHGTLEEAIDRRAEELRKLELGAAKARASAAFAHYAEAAGFEPGEAWSLPVRAVWQALGDAMTHLVDASESSQLIDSAVSTPGSGGTSSTD